jgi:hypothetical protein
MANLIAGFLIWKHPSIFVNVVMWEHCTFDYKIMKFLDVAKFTTLTPLSLLMSYKPSFPVIGLKTSSLPTLALKSPDRIFIWY